mmetsp:Transcript_26325/g.69136  ORF Transcript_26325/g.69136 Transcript_26325/m.69136 type:complete len:94 (-) Transcript_26325:623-904(-)
MHSTWAIVRFTRISVATIDKIQVSAQIVVVVASEPFPKLYPFVPQFCGNWFTQNILCRRCRSVLKFSNEYGDMFGQCINSFRVSDFSCACICQ